MSAQLDFPAPPPTADPPVLRFLRANLVAIAIAVVGGIASLLLYAVGLGKLLERVEVIEKAHAATTDEVRTIKETTSAAQGRTDRNLARICQKLEIQRCETP